jgi:hypothetical protein
MTNSEGTSWACVSAITNVKEVSGEGGHYKGTDESSNSTRSAMGTARCMIRCSGALLKSNSPSS